MAEVPAWVGWPGTGPAPGHDWVPGPKLRFVILLLAYSFLALALTVDYAYSVTFFLLAIIGTYVGLRRGFGNGLTRAEKLVMIACAAYPAVAIATYLVGTQTNVGFRFLGRDLRFLLFIPAYLSVRWARPSRTHLSLALGAGALAALAVAAIRSVSMVGGGQLPHGVAGTHIVFGDLALLSGFLSGMLIIAGRRGGWWISLSVIVIFAGVAASVLSMSRGGWLAIPVLAVFALSVLPHRRRRLAIAGSLAIAIVAIAATGAFLPKVVNRADSALQHARFLAEVEAQNSHSKLEHAICPNTLSFMHVLKSVISVHPLDARSFLKIKSDPKVGRMRPLGAKCRSDYVFEVSAPNSMRAVWVGMRRHVLPGGYQKAAILVRGSGQVRVWNMPPVTVDSPLSYRVRVLGGRDSSSNPFLNIWIPGGKNLRFIPLQLHRGEYTRDILTTSIGSRWIMWAAALHAFLQHPLLGTGTGTFQYLLESSPVAAALSDAGRLYQHPHDDVLNALYSGGLLGLSVLLALYMMFFLPGADRTGVRVSRAAGTALIIFGLTESMLVHSLVISYWAMLFTILLTVRTRVLPAPEHPYRCDSAAK